MIEIIKSFFKGIVTKKQHGIILAFALLLLAILWSTAQFLFDGHYSPLNNTISNQGRTDYNPQGYIFFTIGCATSGFFIIFHFIWLYRKYYPTLRPVLLISVLAGILGGVTFICVGFVPGDINKPVHGVFARLAFGSFYTSVCSFLAVLLRKIQKKEEWPTIKSVGFAYALFVALLLLVIIIPELDFIATIWDLDPRLFEWPIWQWTAFFNVLIWMVNIYFLTPINKKMKN